MECHKDAMRYLHDSLQLTDNARSRESLQLQIDSHQKLVDSLKIKKTQFEDLRRYQESVKNRVVNFECESGETLQQEIYRTMETHDSLIEVLIKRNCDDEYMATYVTDEEKTTTSDTCDGLNISGKKRQVDVMTHLEEFRGLSEKLRELVQALVVQLEERENEIARLKATVYKLECEKNKGKVIFNCRCVF